MGSFYPESFYLSVTLKQENCLSSTDNFKFKNNFIIANEFVSFESNYAPRYNQKLEAYFYLVGEIYHGNQDQLDFFIKNYSISGIEFLSEVNGSFALVIIDLKQEEVFICTDRSNSRKIFRYDHLGDKYYSTSMKYLDLKEAKLDKSCIASYLVNGTVYNYKTLFKDVSILERATLNLLIKNISTKYWDFLFTNEYSDRKPLDLQEELYDHLKESISRRVLRDDNIYISLSGGFDISSVLGILAEDLKVKSVNCRSYYLTNLLDTKRSDVDIAQRQAYLYGYDFKRYKALAKENTFNAINQNAAWGEGISNFCEEVDYWDSIKNESENSPISMFFGEEVFGLSRAFLNNDNDLLRLFHLNNIDSIQNSNIFFDKKSRKEIFEDLNENFMAILKRIPKFDENYDKQSYIHFDQISSNIMMSWRNFFAGRIVRIRNPYLDNEILDFIRKLDPKHRYFKNLFKKTVIAKLPELFSIPRASSVTNINAWENRFLSNKDIIEKIILEKNELNAIIDQKNVKHLFKGNITSKLYRKLYRYNRKLMRVSPFYLHKNLYKVKNSEILKRYLVLKQFVKLNKG